MNVALKPELEQFVKQKISAGQYANASEVISDALSVFKEQDEIEPKHKAHLRREIAKGLAQADRGEFADFTAESVIAAGRKRLARKKGK